MRTVPQRIVSLTPSITETIFAIGAGDRLVGVTDACDYPAAANDLPHVCSWIEPDMDRIQSLEPDLAVGLSAAHRHLTPRFEAMGIPMRLLDPASVSDALQDMLTMGAWLDVSTKAADLVDGLRLRLEALGAAVAAIPPVKRLTVSRVLEVSEEGLIVAGPLSFQYDVISCAGGVNVTDGLDAAYPKVGFPRFMGWDPDVVFLCGQDRHRISRLRRDSQWQALASVRAGRLYQFPCGLTCRTGPRIVDMAELLFRTLYPAGENRV